MKTPEQLLDALRGKNNWGELDVAILGGALLDAVRHGMTLAADMVRSQRIMSDFALSHPDAEQFMSEKILSARERLTAEQLHDGKP